MFTVELKGDKELEAQLGAMPGAVQAAVRVKAASLALKLEDRVKGKLSNDVLHVRSGDLRRSIFSEYSESGDTFTGRVASSGDVRYAAIHEFGGVIHHPSRPSHVRLRTDAKGELLRQATGNKGAVFAKLSHKRARIVETQTKAYDQHMPQRSFLGSSFREMAEQIETELKQAVLAGLKTAAKG